MTDERQNIPIEGDEEEFVDNFIENPEDDNTNDDVVADASPAAPSPEDIEIPTAPPPADEQPESVDDKMGKRLERLGGEPAPVITPEEFARLQKSGQVNIDSRGRVRTARRDDAEAGVSLRKRRAWYGATGYGAGMESR